MATIASAQSGNWSAGSTWAGGADEQAQRAELAQRRANLSAKKDEEMMNIIIGG